MNLLLWIFAFIGHLGAWCVVYNRTHATSWPRKTRKICEKLVILAVAIPFVWFLTRAISSGTQSYNFLSLHSPVEWFYLFLVTGMGVFFFLRWSWRTLQQPPAALVSHEQRVFDVQEKLGRNIYLTPIANALKKIPFNQAHCIAIEKIEIELDRLPGDLDGLRICHLSDFHLTGQLDLAYFQRVAVEANAFEPDLIVITGDLIDEDSCLDWIEPIFGQLEAKHGVFFIRGNHDLRITDQQTLLERLKASGMKWVGGGKWDAVEINGARLQLAGNELPWHKGAETLEQAPESNETLKVLFTHSPDQIDWANPFGFDLILAGHTHGGQIVLPAVGPIVAPSKYGVRYASGTFEIGNAIMHVSRGLSGDECIRINCPPEIGHITLRQKKS